MEFREDKKMTFQLYIVPSMMIYAGNNFRPAYDAFDDKIIDYVKEQHIHKRTFVKYVGAIRRVDDLAKKKPLEFLRKAAAKDGNVVALVGEVDDVVTDVCLNKCAKMYISKSGFAWRRMPLAAKPTQVPVSIDHSHLLTFIHQLLLMFVSRGNRCFTF
jgi:hypothetical protein